MLSENQLKWAKTPGNYDSLNISKIYPSDNIYGIPNIPVQGSYFKPKDLIPYGSRKKDAQDYGLHFFVDDYRFEPAWNRPVKTLSYIKQFGVVLAPDFSLYTDFPRVAQIWNVYRSRWLACYWIENGVNVIPTITWGDESSFDFCFEGVPKHSIVAISGMGSRKAKTKEAYLKGFKEMVRRLEPQTIIVYGGTDIPLEDYAPNIYRYKTYWEKRKGE